MVTVVVATTTSSMTSSRATTSAGVKQYLTPTLPQYPFQSAHTTALRPTATPTIPAVTTTGTGTRSTGRHINVKICKYANVKYTVYTQILLASCLMYSRALPAHPHNT